MTITVSDIIRNNPDGIAISADRFYTGTRHALSWAEILFGSTPITDRTLTELKRTSFIYKWLNVGKIFESLGEGVRNARERMQRWEALPKDDREEFALFAATTFVEDLSGPVSDSLGFICANLKLAPPSVSKGEPYAYAFASGIAATHAAVSIHRITNAYRSSDDQEKKHHLLVKLAKTVASFVLGVLGVIALYYGPLYSTVSLLGVSVLYTLGIYEDTHREVLPSLPSF